MTGIAIVILPEIYYSKTDKDQSKTDQGGKIMRITVKEKNRERILQVVCNCCRRSLPVENGIVLEDYLHIDKVWGYFSTQDGEEIVFDLCEDCTRELTKRFRLPVYQRETREYL